MFSKSKDEFHKVYEDLGYFGGTGKTDQRELLQGQSRTQGKKSV